MKVLIFILFCYWLSPASFCQFPAPATFSALIEYVDMDGQGWTNCAGQVIYAPAYCTHFTWSVPDTSTTEATLVYYKIYRNGNHVLSVANDTWEDAVGAYTGYLCVTAYYSNPEGESDTSNHIFVDNGLPDGIHEKGTEQDLLVKYDKNRQLIAFQNNAKTIERVSIIDLQGRYISMKSMDVSFIETSGLSANIYIVEVGFKDKSVVRKKMMIY